LRNPARRQRPDGRWRARYLAPDGHWRAQHFDKKADATRFLDGVAAQVTAGSYVDRKAGKVTFGEYADEWRATKADVARSTMLNIDGRMRKHAKPFFDRMPVASVRPTHARAFVADLVAQGLAPSTVKGIALSTSQVFGQAVNDGIIARNPFANVGLPSDRHREEVHFLDAGQVNELAASIGERYRAAIYLAAYGGLRAGELWALRVDRVNVLAATVDVVESASEASGWHVGPTKTGKVRTITVPRIVATMLGEHIGHYSAEYLFTAAEGGPVHHRNFRRRHYLPAVARAGLPAGVRFHDLRHTCAALLIANGQHMEEVKDYLGHSSIRVTSDRYGHLFPKARAALADALNNTLAESSLANARDFSGTTAAIAQLPERERATR
jgi:integrase